MYKKDTHSNTFERWLDRKSIVYNKSTTTIRVENFKIKINKIQNKYLKVKTKKYLRSIDDFKKEKTIKLIYLVLISLYGQTFEVIHLEETQTKIVNNKENQSSRNKDKT